MRNAKASCIFEYCDFLYTIDFSRMIMWVVCEEDDTPITTLELKRVSNSEWHYRPTYEDGEREFIRETDLGFQDLLNGHYAQYITAAMVSNNARSRSNTTLNQNSRVRKTDR